MGSARVLVSFELLRQVLHLPMATDIRLVNTADWQTAEITLQHPDLPDVPVPEGGKPPLATPTFRKQDAVEFLGWNVET